MEIGTVNGGTSVGRVALLPPLLRTPWELQEIKRKADEPHGRRQIAETQHRNKTIFIQDLVTT
jgi:hypothetical protein